MTTSGATIVARARALIGIRFRSHGRSSASGLDCIGLVAAATGTTRVPDGYALRGGSMERLAAELHKAAFRSCETLEPGDVLVLLTGPGQFHFGVWTGDGLVHADAALRRVVERPGSPPWALLGIWRRIFEEA